VDAVDLDGVDNPDGDAERVEGALTTIESMVDAVVEREVVDPVLSTDAASLGRPGGTVMPVGLVAFRLIRAASWLSEGGRVLLVVECFSGCLVPASGAGEGDGELMVVGLRRRWRCNALRMPPTPNTPSQSTPMLIRSSTFNPYSSNHPTRDDRMNEMRNKMHGRFLGPMPVEKFLDEFLPCEQKLPIWRIPASRRKFKEMRAQTEEKHMYPLLVRSIYVVVRGLHSRRA
jgi:hypothetical protein